MTPRLYVDVALDAGLTLALPSAAVRHVQVLRLQPGDAVTLFNGRGGEWSARIAAMTGRAVQTIVVERHAIERELTRAVTLALVMPAGDRMDFVVEKAIELGADSIIPLMSDRSVLRLAGERAQRRQAHWQAIAVAACEQCGRNLVPQIQLPLALAAWLTTLAAPQAAQTRYLLAWRHAQPWAMCATASDVVVLSGPEGGLTPSEEDAARQHGFVPTTLGPRVLRADTAPLAALAALSLAA